MVSEFSWGFTPRLFLKNVFFGTSLIVVDYLYSFQLEGECDFHFTGFWGYISI